MTYTVIFVILFVHNYVIHLAYTYGNGAPRDDIVCENLSPRHHVTSQTTECPFFVTTNTSTTFDASDVVTVSITSPVGRGFKGYAIQLRMDRISDKEVKTVGTFITDPDTKFVSCFGETDTATHSNSEEKKEVHLSIKVPKSRDVQNFNVRATILQDFHVYWTGITVRLQLSPVNGSFSYRDTNWFNSMSNTARSIASGSVQWAEDIEQRLSKGFSEVVDSHGKPIAIEITNSLPFHDKYPGKSDREPSTGFYRSNKYPNVNLSQTAMVEELLQGDLRFAHQINLQED